VKGFDAHVGPTETALEQAPEAFEPVGANLSNNVGYSVVDDLVGVGAFESTIREQGVGVDAGSALYAHALLSYQDLASDYAHQVIDHSVAYVDGKVDTNGLENFWSLLKRGINGTYISVERFQLFRYLDEQAYRFNNRSWPMQSDSASRFLVSLASGSRSIDQLTGTDTAQA